ncbi:MAG: serine/threonine protein kinase [Verrucomicrobiaceae bacterium]|nr:serine/threonine protein kinase [Verrucomicrobiaceae bacterium]
MNHTSQHQPAAPDTPMNGGVLVLKTAADRESLRAGRGAAATALRLRNGASLSAPEVTDSLRAAGQRNDGTSIRAASPAEATQTEEKQKEAATAGAMNQPEHEIPPPAKPQADLVVPSGTVGSTSSTRQGQRPSTKSLVLRKKQDAVIEGGRDDVLESVTEPVCCNCRVAFSIDAELGPLARIVCPRCNTRQVVPARIGHFIMERELGRGGMGVTYRAFDQSLQRNVAVKIISEERAASRENVESMVREARRAATLTHPHIVPVHSIGSVEGRPYFVMELLSDGQFHRPLSKGVPLDETLVLETGLAVARALAEAAARGILHLDVKPGNILHDRFGVAKLIDFGLACHSGDDASKGWGTCLYMAPERLLRKGQDFRSDQYSLGLTLWHALAGKAPYEAPDLEQLMYKILERPPPLINELRRDILDWTAGLIHKMIAPDPADRYQTSDQLTWAFEFVLDALRPKSGKSTTASPSAS